MHSIARHIWLIGLTVAMTAMPAFAQRQWVRFDGSVETSPGLTFSFARAASVYDPAGQLLPPDVPRWAPPTLFCGLPRNERLAVSLATNAIAAGVDTDGNTPVYVINTSTNERLSVHFGKGAVEKAFRDRNWSGTYMLFHGDTSKGGRSNILWRQFGNNGGTPDIPTMAFSTTDGATVHNGLIVLGCDVLEQVDGEWTSRRAGLAFTTTDRLTQKDPLIIAAVGLQTDAADTMRGSPWAFSAFPISDDELIVVMTDYRRPVKTGGICYATRFLKVAGEWTHETIRIARSETPTMTQHWHCGGLIRHPDGRETILISIGDGISDNSLIASTLAAGGAWSNGVPIEGTGIDDRSRVYSPSADWTMPETVWGGVGDSPPQRHNQVISMVAADAGFSELLCGADETNAPILKLGYNPDTKMPEWTTLSLPSVTSAPGDGVLNFSMRGLPGGPYLGRIDAAAVTPWQANERETRILYSPDGTHWGQCFVASTSGHRQAVPSDGVAYIGSKALEGAGLRRLEMPFSTLIRPLIIGSSQTNLMRPDMQIPQNRVDFGVIITAINGIENLPTGVPPPPCDPSNMFRIENYSNAGRLGLWHPASDLQDTPAPDQSVLMRAWVYALRPDEPGQPQTTAQLAARLSDSTLEHLNYWTDRADFESGKWMPFAIWAKWSKTIDDTADPLAPEEPWLPEVFLRTERQSNRTAFSRFLIAWEGLYLDTPTIQSNGLPARTDAATEDVVLEGLDLNSDWSMLLVGMVPDDQWDNRVGGSGKKGSKTNSDHLPTLFTLEDSRSGDRFLFQANPPREGVFATLFNGSMVKPKFHDYAVYWLRQSPVTVLIRAADAQIAVNYSVGGSIPKTFSVNGTLNPDRLRLGPDPLWWRSVEAIPYALKDHEVTEVFQMLTLPCPADFNSDGVVDSRDIIAFLAAWTGGAIGGDFNGDGEVNSLDVIAFLSAYADGC